MRDIDLIPVRLHKGEPTWEIIDELLETIDRGAGITPEDLESATSSAYDEGFDDGFDEGKAEGLDFGYSAGYESGFRVAKEYSRVR